VTGKALIDDETVFGLIDEGRRDLSVGERHQRGGPLLAGTHAAHLDVVRWRDQREVALAGPALAETYAALTRLPGALRLDPRDAATPLVERIFPPLTRLISQLGIVAGPVCDALVALAAAGNKAPVATRGARAQRPYERVDVQVGRAG
jgi:hypothetical protein